VSALDGSSKYHTSLMILPIDLLAGDAPASNYSVNFITSLHELDGDSV